MEDKWILKIIYPRDGEPADRFCPFEYWIRGGRFTKNPSEATVCSKEEAKQYASILTSPEAPVQAVSLEAELAESRKSEDLLQFLRGGMRF